MKNETKDRKKFFNWSDGWKPTTAFDFFFILIGFIAGLTVWPFVSLLK